MHVIHRLGLIVLSCGYMFWKPEDQAIGDLLENLYARGNLRVLLPQFITAREEVFLQSFSISFKVLF